MKKFFTALVLVILTIPAIAQWCPSCVQNSAAPQQAQFNISSATIRGPLTVGSINISSITLSSATAGVFIGSGTLLTNLNASQLLLGTVPAARIAGAYSGVTGLGTVSQGTWTATAVGTQFGGTGQNFGSAAAGAIAYFTSVGTMSILSPPTVTSVLMENGSNTAFWASSPTVSGANVSNIPLKNLQSGTLPYSITVATNSIPLVLGSSIQGNISGNATNITGNLSLSQLSAGTLPNNVPASSITVTGVAPGYYGGKGQAMLINIQSDGRVASISQSTYSVSPSSITPGPLPSGVTIGAAQITSGTLAGNVIASSVAASGVAAGSYVGTSQIPQLTVGVDGRLTSVTQANIALPLSQLNSGTLASGVLVPAANINAGSLGSQVVASSIAANGVIPGTYGSSTYVPHLTVGADGRITSISSATVSGGSGAQTNVDNLWTAPQTFQSSVTISAALSATNAVFTTVTGIGSGLTNLSPGNLASGLLPSNVIASSIAANGVAAGEYGSATYIPQVTVGGDGRVTSISSTAFTSTPTGPVGGDLTGTLPNPQVIKASNAAGLTVSYGLSAQNAVFGALPTVDTITTAGNLTMAPTAVITSSAGVISGGPMIDVRIYGAKCDGSTDDTAAIQAALNQFTNGNAGTGSGTLLFPPTLCSITSTLYYGGSAGYAVRLAGVVGASNGSNGSGIVWNGAAGGTMMILLGANQMTIDDMVFNANNSAKYAVVVTATNQLNTTLGTAVSSAGSHSVTPGSIVNIATGTLLNVDSGSQFEIVTVTGVSGASFTATFAKTHSGTASIGNSAGSSGVTFRRDSFLNSNGVNSAEVAVGNPSTTASNQISELHFANSNFFGGSNSYYGFTALSAGNTKDYNFVECEFSSHRVHANLANASGVANFYGAILGNSTVSDFIAGAASLNIDGVESEPSSGSQFVTGTTGASAGQLTVKNSVFAVAASTTNNDVILSYQGSVILLNNEFQNLRTSTAIPYIQIDDPLFYTGSNDGNTLISESNWYLNAPAGYAPIVDANNNTVLPTYYNHQPVDVISRFDLGGPVGTIVKLYDYQPVHRLTSQTAQYVPGLGLLAAGTTDYAVVFRNDANTGDVVGLTKDHSDVVHVGDVGGVSVQSIASTGSITGLSSATASAFFGDGSHITGISTNPFTGGAVPNTTTFASTVTISANAFSVGTSSFVVTNGRVSIGVPLSLVLNDVTGSLWGNANLNFENGTGTFAGLTVNGSQIYAPYGGIVSIQSDFNVANTGAVSILANGSAATTIGQPATFTSSLTVTNASGIYASNGPIQSGNTQINTTGLALGANSNPAVQGIAASGNSVLQSCGSAGCFHKLYDSSGNLGLYVAPSLGFVGIGTTSPQYALHVSSGIVYVDGANSGVKASTVTLTQNSAVANLYPNTPLTFTGNTNTYLQIVGQNLSNGANASTDISLTNDLGADTSFYFNIGINSSKFSQTGQSAEKSSSTYVVSSDSDLLLWAGTNGGLNGAQSENLIFGSSNPVSANVAAYVLPATASGPGAFVLRSSFTVTSSSGVLATSSMTASAFFGDGSHLTGITGGVSGLTVGAVPVATASNALGSSSFITSVSTGVGVSTNVLVGSGGVGLGAGLCANTSNCTGPSSNFVELFAGNGSGGEVLISTPTTSNTPVGVLIQGLQNTLNASGTGGSVNIIGGAGNGVPYGAINLGQPSGYTGLQQPINMYGNLNAPVGSTVTTSGLETFSGTSTTTFASGSQVYEASGSSHTFNPGGANMMVEIVPAEQSYAYSTPNVCPSTITWTLSNYLQPWETSASSITWQVQFEMVASSSSFYVVVNFNGDVAQHYANEAIWAESGGISNSNNSLGSAWGGAITGYNVSGNVPTNFYPITQDFIFEQTGSSNTVVGATQWRPNPWSGGMSATQDNFLYGGSGTAALTTITLVGTTESPASGQGTKSQSVPMCGDFRLYRSRQHK